MRTFLFLSVFLGFLVSAAQAQNDSAAVRLAIEGFAAFNAGRTGESETLVARAAALAPNNGSVLGVYGWVLVKLQKMELAETILRKAAELVPNEPAYYRNLGEALWQLDRKPEAESAFATAYRLEPAPSTLLRLGESKAVQGRYAEGEADLRNYISQAPSDPIAFAWLAYALNGQNRFEEVIAAAREAFRLGDHDPNTHSLLGLAFYYMDKMLEALQELGEAVRLAPDQPSYVENLAKAKTRQLPPRTPVGASGARAVALSGTSGTTVPAAPAAAANAQTTVTNSNAAGNCSGSNLFKIVQMDEPYCLKRGIEGYDLAGTYTYDNTGNGPRTHLDVSGTGWWENDGGPTNQQSSWGIQVAMDGSPMKQSSQYGEIHRLWLQNAVTGKWQIWQIAISYPRRMIVIAGERIKSF